MKYITFPSLFLLLVSLTIFSCSSDDPQDNCTLDSRDLVIAPYCSFLPSEYPDVIFPVRVLHDSLDLAIETHMFQWSSDPDFGGGAISISYMDLPLSVTVTDIATDCEATTELTADYWD